MNLLVTGAAGFNGSTHVRTLLAGEAAGAPEATDAPRITVLDKLSHAGTLDNLQRDHPPLEFVQHDFTAGLADTVTSYRDHRAWSKPLKRRAALQGTS